MNMQLIKYKRPSVVHMKTGNWEKIEVANFFCRMIDSPYFAEAS